MKKRNLRSLLYKSFLNTSLIPLIVIEITLLILYFGISSFMVKNSQDSLSFEIKNNLNSILQKESQYIQHQLQNVSSSALKLQNEQQNMFKNKNRYLSIIEKPEFKKADNGVFYKVNNDGGASLFYAATTKITQKEIQKAHFSEAFDNSLKYVVDTNDLIVASYFNSYDNMNRLYPFIPKVYSQFPADIVMEDYNFYYEADAKHNSKKTAVWTDAYLDPAGQGWMLSCIVPIYNGEFLEGVTGLDVTIDKFIKNILNLDLPWGAKAFLTNKDGTILAMPSKVEEILSLKELKEHEYKETIKETKLKPEDYNLLKNEKLASIFKPIKESNKNINEVIIDSNKYLIANTKVAHVDWDLYIILDENVVFKSVYEVKELSTNLGFIAILGMVLFYILFFIFLNSKVRKISKDIAVPISALAHSTKNFSSDIRQMKFKEVNISEIDTLSNNFNKMTGELHKKTSELKDLNENLEIKIEQEVEKNRQKDQKIFRQARFVHMGEMLNMIAHQWRQPLNAISTTTNNMIFKIMLDEYDKDFFEKETKLISQYSQELSKTIDNFRNFFKENNEKVKVSINDILISTLSIIGDSLEDKKISLHEDLKSNIELHTYPSELQQVLINIIKNSEHAILQNNITNGVISVKSFDKDQYTYIQIEDNGGGISKDIINNIFDPYFTTKDEKEEVGLGLYMSKMIIEEHCYGKIDVKSEGSNTILTISLPSKEDKDI